MRLSLAKGMAAGHSVTPTLKASNEREWSVPVDQRLSVDSNEGHRAIHREGDLSLSDWRARSALHTAA
jgi:hypothetical protein